MFRTQILQSTWLIEISSKAYLSDVVNMGWGGNSTFEQFRKSATAETFLVSLWNVFSITQTHYCKIITNPARKHKFMSESSENNQSPSHGENITNMSQRTVPTTARNSSGQKRTVYLLKKQLLCDGIVLGSYDCVRHLRNRSDICGVIYRSAYTCGK